MSVGFLQCKVVLVVFVHSLLSDGHFCEACENTRGSLKIRGESQQ